MKKLTSKKSLRLFRDEALTSAICDVKREYGAANVNFNSSLFDRTYNSLIETAYDKRIPIMAKCYFSEMYEVFSGLAHNLNNNAKIFIDLGDSIFGGIHIPTDLILIEVLENLGYKSVDRTILRKRRSKNGQLLSQVLLKFNYSHV